MKGILFQPDMVKVGSAGKDFAKEEMRRKGGGVMLERFQVPTPRSSGEAEMVKWLLEWGDQPCIEHSEVPFPEALGGGTVSRGKIKRRRCQHCWRALKDHWIIKANHILLRRARGAEVMKGVLFTPDMIQAILEGPKTHTRRVMKPQPIDVITDKRHGNRYVVRELKGKRCWCAKYADTPPRGRMITSRYQVGEVVYIKEAWATEERFDPLTPKQIEEWGKAAGVAVMAIWYKHNDTQLDREGQTRGRWRSPLYMPAWAARYFLRILNVRAQRLQEINGVWHDDVLKEGYPFSYNLQEVKEHPVTTFARYWDSLNPKYPWESNPWVWDYEFEKEEK